MSNYRPYSRQVQHESEFASLFTKVFLWMFVGLLISGVTAYSIAHSGTVISDGLFLAVGIGLIVYTVVISFTIRRVSAPVAYFYFITYTALEGVMLSIIFLAYELPDIYSAFFITAGVFAGAAIYGFVTKKDLSSLGSILTILLIGLIIAMIIDIFINNSVYSFIVSAVAILIFVAVTAYDIYKIKNHSNSYKLNENENVCAIFYALEIYLDFINIFLHVLKLKSSSD